MRSACTPALVGNQARHVDGEVVLQRGVLVEIRHHQVRVGVLLDVDGDAQAFLLVGFVGEIGRLRQLAFGDDARRCRLSSFPLLTP